MQESISSTHTDHQVDERQGDPKPRTHLQEYPYYYYQEQHPYYQQYPYNKNYSSYLRKVFGQ